MKSNQALDSLNPFDKIRALMRLRLRQSTIIVLLSLVAVTGFGQTQTTDQGNANPAPVKVGDGVSPPRPIHTSDPQYSEEARHAHFQGTCVLWLVVDSEGHPRDIKVARTLGKGLDEKAIEAVRKWKFEPARKDGKPVAVQINVEVTFRLDGSPQNAIDIQNLRDKANKGDPTAEFELAKRYLVGQDVPKDPQYGTELLLKAAKHGYPEAQFLMGELYVLGNAAGDPVEAYMWYGVAERSGYKDSNNKLKALELKLSPEQLAEARSRIDSWRATSPAK
jgi:TonB family protein